MCLLHSFDECAGCKNFEFELDLLKGTTPVPCPVLEAASSGRVDRDDPYMKSDIAIAKELIGGDIPETKVQASTCVSERPFMTCPGCKVKRRWTIPSS